jgi:predicted ATPase
MLAEVYGKTGQTEAGLRLLDEVLAEHTNTEQHYAVEVYRLHGELLLQHGQEAAAVEAHFHLALDIARQQQAKTLELRAALSLSRLWQQQGKRQEAYDLLAPVYGWFTEGFDTADLQEAKQHLANLRRKHLRRRLRNDLSVCRHGRLFCHELCGCCCEGTAGRAGVTQRQWTRPCSPTMCGACS